MPSVEICRDGYHGSGVSGNSRSRSFPRMEASDSLSRTLGMDFFIPFPFPNFGNGFFSFPSRSRILGIDFFIPFPFPNFGNGFFSFPSRSRIEGMGFFNSLPVPELWEWNYPFPFPFPNSQMFFPLTPESLTNGHKKYITTEKYYNQQ